MTAINIARRFLVNSTPSDNMAVDGSVTPVDFIYSPPPGTIYTVFEISLTATGTGNFDQALTKFWSFPALTNGISIKTRVKGIEILQPSIIKSNFDMIEYLKANFREKAFGSKNIVTGGFAFPATFTLNSEYGDFFSMTISDNLTTSGAIEAFTVSLFGSLITL